MTLNFFFYFYILLLILSQNSHAMINSEVSEHHPYYAYVEFANAQGSGYGGGVLISFQHVLTCAANIQG